MTTARELAKVIHERMKEFLPFGIHFSPGSKSVEDALEPLLQSALGEAERRCVNEHANAERLIAWIKTPERERKPANIAFTEGPDRQVAYHIESALGEAERKTIEKFAGRLKAVRDEAYEDAAKICDALTSELDESTDQVFSQKLKQAIKKMNGSVVSEECAERIRSCVQSISGSSADAAGGGKAT